MISGSVAFSGSPSSFLSVIEHQSPAEITFHSVKNEYFSGGFYLNSRLPWRKEDIFSLDMSNDIMVLLSGSVYNREELINTRNIPDHASDPEIITELFLREGHTFVRRLNGDFVIFILRPARREAYLFRDHLGIRPVAWVRRGETLTFSMDIMGLCRYFGRESAVDNEFLLGYFKYIDYRRTPNSEIKKLLPGHCLRFSGSAIQLVRYWEPEKIRIDSKLPYRTMVDDLGELVQNAVRLRSDSRFTAGAHVSSGIDSGIVSALARKEYGHQEHFYGFSWSPAGSVAGDFIGDERKIIMTSCQKKDIKPVLSDLDATNFLRLISDHYHNQGYYSEAATSEQAEKLGVNLLFTGWGGDEFISTGHSGIDLDLLARLKFAIFFRRNKVTKLKKFARHLLFFVIYPALHILDPGSAKAFRQDVRYVKEPYKRSDRRAISSFYFHRSRRQMHLNVFRFYNLPERCESWYHLGFQKGIEYRYPLLDKRIIEYILKVPSELLCKSDHFRPLLREIGKGILPEEVRLNESKNDPVYRSWMDGLFREAAFHYMEEVDAWRDNKDLQFIDFDLLMDDISGYRSQSLAIDSKVLFRGMVYIKAIHEFTMKYRELHEF